MLQAVLRKMTSVKTAAKLPLKTVGLRVEICDEAAAMDWLSARLHEASAQKPV